MEISEVRVKLVSNKDDRLKAFCSITMDNEFVVRDIKIIEGTTANVPPAGGRKHPHQEFVQIDTSNILSSQYLDPLCDHLDQPHLPNALPFELVCEAVAADAVDPRPAGDQEPCQIGDLGLAGGALDDRPARRPAKVVGKTPHVAGVGRRRAAGPRRG